MSVTYTISELAREFGVTPRAIRFYEDQGLIQPARDAGGRNRVYSGRDRTRLKLTLRGKRIGLSLTEILEIVDMYDTPQDTVPQLERFVDILARHRRNLEQQKEEIDLMLEELSLQERGAKALLDTLKIRPEGI
jgi:DNA-binding transcriptional MerR regulator